jgi:CDP-diacylglycerol--serine O-phosphatidyltransferase
MVGFYNYTVILTYIGVASAVLGVGLSMYGRTSMAVVCLMVSGFCDLFDGSIARTRARTINEKKFGIQIDSLADLVCFGILPAAIGFSIGMTRLYEAAVLIVYVLAALIRLAYYNVTEDEIEFCENSKRVYYDGLPVTTIAILIPMIYTLRDEERFSAAVCAVPADDRDCVPGQGKGAKAWHERHDRSRVLRPCRACAANCGLELRRSLRKEPNKSVRRKPDALLHANDQF